MRFSFAALAAVVALAVVLVPVCGLPANSTLVPAPDFIVTAAPSYVPLAELRGQERFPKGAQLLLVHGGKAEPLVSGFAASADANLSFDAHTVLFSGKQSAADPWQIWELNLTDHSVRKVVSTDTDAERPLYLPGGRMVWAQRTAFGFQMQSVEDGHPMPRKVLNPTTAPGMLLLTSVRANAFPQDVLRDGRVLFESGFPLGEGSTPDLYLVYADGSGVESVRCDHGRARWGGTELASGDIVFTHGASLARFTSPLAHEESLPTAPGSYSGAIAETVFGDWLVSVKEASEAHYTIKSRKPAAVAMRTVLAVSGQDLIEPVIVAPRTTPNRHPSGLHPWDYANLLALDSRVSRDGDLKALPVAVRVESQDGDGHTITMGTAPVEKDGSFFVQIPGDRPIRFELLDFKGTVLRQEKGWFWARGGEQRICVGCHAGPERASENRVPDVLMHTTTPVDLTGKKPTVGAQGGH